MLSKWSICAVLLIALLGGACNKNLSNAADIGHLAEPQTEINVKPVSPANGRVTPTPVRKDKKMSENELTQVTLKAKTEIVGGNLNVSYEAENHSNEDVYLWDGMIGFEGTEKIVDHNRVYVFFEEPNTVRLIRANLPLPRLKKVKIKRVLFARLLKAKSTLSGKFSLPQPVREHSPYYEPMKDDEKEIKRVSRIRLLVAWTPPKAGMKIDERDVNGEKWFKIRGVWDPPYQEVLEQIIPLETELLTYTAAFERQIPLR